MSTPAIRNAELHENSAVAGFLARLDFGVGPLLTEKNYVDLALAFASIELPAGAQLARACLTQLVTGVRVDDLLPDLPVPESDTSALQQAQSQFLTWLEIVRAGEQGSLSEIAPVLHRAGSRMLICPSFVMGTNAVDVSYRYYPVDFEAALGFVLMLLLDCNRPFRGELCRCRFSGCQRYFLAIKPLTGRPRRDYCSREHLSEARKAENAARVRLYRAKKRAQPKRPMRRRPK